MNRPFPLHIENAILDRAEETNGAAFSLETVRGYIRTGGTMTMTPSEHEKSEWSRLARDAYGRDFNNYGHRFSGAAAIHKGESIPIATFDALQADYREWLINGWKNVSHTSSRGVVDYSAPCDFAGCSMCLNHPGAHSNV